MCAAAMLGVVDCVADRVRFAVPEPTAAVLAACGAAGGAIAIGATAQGRFSLLVTI